MINGLDLCIRTSESINKHRKGEREFPLLYLKKCRAALEIALATLEELSSPSGDKSVECMELACKEAIGKIKEIL